LALEFQVDFVNELEKAERKKEIKDTFAISGFFCLADIGFKIASLLV